jgi:WD40 repeat protein
MDAAVEAFTGRKWVLERVDAWLTRGEGPTFLLVGDAGTGKSAIARRVVTIERGEAAAEGYSCLGAGVPLYAHFCVALDPEALDPLGFVRGLARALASRSEPYALALMQLGEQKIEIVGTASAETAEAGAELTGVRIGEIRIGEMSAELAFERLVRAPLAGLSAADLPERIVVLADALDEALTLRAEENLVTLLGTVATAGRLPPQIRFLLTSRPDPRVLHSVGMPALDLEADAPRGIDDVRAYAYGRLRKLPKVKRAAVARQVAAAAHSNFLYARYVLDDLERRGEALDPKTLALPDGLPDIYEGFLKRELARAGEPWEERYRPLLGLLAVARGDGLTSRALAGATGVPADRADDALRAIAQYVAGPLPRGPLRLYHESFRNFLLSSTDFGVYPELANARLGEFLVDEFRGEWLEAVADEDATAAYALAHAPAHLVEAARGATGRRERREQGERLAALLGDGEFLEAKAASSPLGVDRLLGDLRAAREVVPVEDGRVDEILRVIDREAHNLRRWEPGQQRIGFAQQIRNRARDLRVNALEVAADERLASIGAPYLALRWRAGGESPRLLRFLAGHRGDVTDVAITPAGTRAASASADLTRRLWDVETGRELRAWDDSAPASSLALSSDGRHILEGTETGAKVVDVESGAVMHEFGAEVGASLHEVTVMHEFGAEEGGSLHGVTLTPDGRRAVVAWSTAFVVWDLLTDERRRVVPHTPLMAVAVTSDGEHVLALSRDRVLQKWNLENLELVFELLGPLGLHAIAYRQMNLEELELVSELLGPLGPQAIADRRQGSDVTEEDIAKAWKRASLSTERAMARLAAGGDEELYKRLVESAGKHHGRDDTLAVNQQLKKSTVTSAAVDPEGRRVIWGLYDGHLNIWNTEDGADAYTESRHDSWVLCAAISGDGTKSVTGGSDNVVRMWSVDTAEEVEVLSGHAAHIGAVAVSADGRRAVSGSRTGELIVWDLEAPPAGEISVGHRTAVSSIATVSDGRTLVSGSYDRTVRVWEGETGRQVAAGASEHPSPVRAVGISRDGRHAVSGGLEGQERGELPLLKIWDASSGQELHELRGNTDLIYVDVFDPSNPLRIWNIARMGELKYLTGYQYEVWRICPGSDGRPVLVAAWDRDLKVWDLATGDEIDTLSGHEYLVSALAITPDGRRAISGSVDGTLRVWDLPGPNGVLTPDRHVFQVSALAVTPDGRRAVSRSVDGAMMVWDLDAPRLLYRLTEQRHFLAGLAERPDGGHDVVGWSGTLLKIWQLESGKERPAFKAHDGRISSVTIPPDRYAAVSSGTDRRLVWWDLDAGEACASVALDGLNVTTAVAQGGTVFAGDSSGRVCCFEMSGPRS